MRKLILWCRDHLLLLSSLALLAFVPLYPKLPLIDIKNTWVYVRFEDFLVVAILSWWITLLWRGKVSLRTPLTVPILLFWLAGAVATLHGMLIIFPTLPSVYANVSFLSFLRRIEYMSVFFVAYSSLRDRTKLPWVIGTLAVTLLTVSLYGLGQKYAGFPAFLTMNEEFAKGIPLTLSALSRVSSTFGGHYDLAAYLVLVVPIIASLIFAYRHPVAKAAGALLVGLGLVVLFMTVSRISFFAVFVSFAVILFFQRRNVILFLIPIGLAGLAGLFFLFPQLTERFDSTVKSVDVLVDASTGEAVGHVQEVPRSYFDGKDIWQKYYVGIGDVETHASPSGSFRIPQGMLSDPIVLLTQPAAPTGEDLPSGSGYINLTLSPVERNLGNFYYEPKNKEASMAAQVYIINGHYLLKKAFAYDLSFTTRFQGEWPKAIAAFQRNVLLGSGYGSVSLAVDNSYLRMLAEVGSLGFALFLLLFLFVGMYASRAWSSIESAVAKSFVLGFLAGVVGLSINALFIDVFEASKVAFVLWLLTGFTMAILAGYVKPPLSYVRELRKILGSPLAVAAYLLLAVIVLYGQMTRNYFVGDDYTWFRWAGSGTVADIWQYFTDAGGFFFRPGMKVYFLLMYHVSWLNQSSYHTVSLILHYFVSMLVFLIATRLFKDRFRGAVAAFLFVSLSGFTEAVFWVSATGYLYVAVCSLGSLYAYMRWKDDGIRAYLAASIILMYLSPLFHELGIVTPVFLVGYDLLYGERRANRREYLAIGSVIPVYLLARFLAHSHWFSGDYSYNLLKLPFNAVGNMIGYLLTSVAGIYAGSAYTALRNLLRTRLFISGTALLAAISVTALLVSRTVSKLRPEERKFLIFSLGFVITALLPFLGLGNIAPRYGYLSGVGVALLLVFGIGKIRDLIAESGKDIATLATAVLISVFVLFQIVSIQQLHRDWYEAGEKVRKFFVSMDAQYHDYWNTAPMTLNFVDVPIRYRNAWVFPVGLSDAIWFVFPNPHVTVNIRPDQASALDAIHEGSPTEKAFVFDSEGKVTELKKATPSTP